MWHISCTVCFQTINPTRTMHRKIAEKRNNPHFEVLLICSIKVSFLIRWASFWFEWVFPVRRWTTRHLNEYSTSCSTMYIMHIESIWIFSLLMMIVDVALIHYILFLFSFIQKCFQREKVFASDMNNMCKFEFLENITTTMFNEICTDSVPLFIIIFAFRVSNINTKCKIKSKKLCLRRALHSRRQITDVKSHWKYVVPLDDEIHTIADDYFQLNLGSDYTYHIHKIEEWCSFLDDRVIYIVHILKKSNILTSDWIRFNHSIQFKMRL